MELFFTTTELLVVFWVGFSIVALGLVFRSSLSFSRKMLIVPLTFLALYVTITQSIELLGKPYEGVPSDEFVFVSYRISVDPTTKKKSILLWTNNKEEGDRLYILPYNEQAKNKLQQAAQRQKQGVMQMGKFKKTKQTGKRLESTLWADIQLYDFPMQTLIPKDNPNK